MSKCFVPFSSKVDSALIPDQLNDPFDTTTLEICKIAANELQEFLSNNQDSWKHNFGVDNQQNDSAKGKMFGVLIVQDSNQTLGYLSTFSGKLAEYSHHPQFVSSVFDVSTDDYFINTGMTELTAIGNQIKATTSNSDIEFLKEKRKNKSILLQQKLFNHYDFFNQKGELKNIQAIFKEVGISKPPSRAGECAAPKLLHYAYQHKMKPIAIAEFWWGKSSKSGAKTHKKFYPACNDKCKPILKYMLGN